MLASLLVVGVLAAVIRLALRGAEQSGAAIAFGAVIALGEVLRITLPGGRDKAPLAATAALGYALVPNLGGSRALWGPVQVIVVVGVASVLGSLPQALVGRPPTAGYLVRRVSVTGLASWLLRSVLQSSVEHMTGSALLLLLCGMACLVLLVDSALATVLTAPPGGYPSDLVSLDGEFEFSDPASSLDGVPQPVTGFGRQQFGAAGRCASALRVLRRFLGAWFEECRATARMCTAVAALAVALALAVGPLGLWVLPVVAAPVLVMQHALRRYAAIRATYQQTIRALSRVTDLAGYTEPGHARRVCMLALVIGRDLGLTERELLDLEYAALLHDIGQLSLADPLPAGATVLATPWVAAEVAVRGVEVVRATGVLDRVARILEAQVTPYSTARLGQQRPSAGAGRGFEPEQDVTDPGGRREPDESELRAAAILRVANDFEDLRTAEPGPAANARALARIRSGIGAPYDPRAVEALTRLFATR